MKLYLEEKYEKEAREKNQYEKLKSDREIQKVFDIMKHYCQTKDTIEMMNGVKKNFQDLFEKFESKIDDLSKASKTLHRKKIQSLYFNFYIFQPHHYNFSGKFVRNLDYSNNLFHTWQDERTKKIEIYKRIFQNLGIVYDLNIPLVEHPCLTSCSLCNICKPTNPKKE